MQEQLGIYGGIRILPQDGLPDPVDRDHVVVLSDWTDEDPHTVMKTLMHGLDWYSIVKGTNQSIVGAARRGVLGEYFGWQRDRMSSMDISDVAYDAFLANGERVHRLAAEPGERVRVRFVNAGASSYFYVSSGQEQLTIVASDGVDVKPVEVKRLLIGMAETYDVEVTMPESGEAIELRATAQDGTGHASVFLGDGPLVEASDPPRANVYSMDGMLTAGLESINPKSGERAATAERPNAPYALLEAREPTALTPHEGQTTRKLTVRLTGDMQRYLWSFDGKTLGEDPLILMRRGEVLQVEFINDTMMHHPLHLHGHFFRVLNGKGDFAPLKHTVDVPPMGQRTIEWLADEEPGDWFFHCHLIYHMDAGMARVFRYEGEGNQGPPGLNQKMINQGFVFFDAWVTTKQSEGQAHAIKGKNDYAVRWDGSLGERENEGEIDVVWSRYFDPNLSTELGYRLSTRPGTRDRGFAGVRYRWPYLVMTALTVDTEGDLRLDAWKNFQVTERLDLSIDTEYDTNTDFEWRLATEWTWTRNLSLAASYHSEYGLGVGFGLHL